MIIIDNNNYITMALVMMKIAHSYKKSLDDPIRYCKMGTKIQTNNCRAVGMGSFP